MIEVAIPNQEAESTLEATAVVVTYPQIEITSEKYLHKMCEEKMRTGFTQVLGNLCNLSSNAVETS